MKRQTSQKSFQDIKYIEDMAFNDFYTLANTLSMLRLHGMEWKLEEMGVIKETMKWELLKRSK